MRKSFIFIFLTQVCYGVSYPFSAILLKRLDPVYWACLRIFLAALVLRALVHVLKIPKSPLPRWTFLWAALVGVGINQLFFSVGLSRSNPTGAALVGTTIPIWVYLASLALREEKFSWQRAAGILLAIAGVFVLYAGSEARVSLLIFLNCVSFSVYLLLLWKMLRKAHPLYVMARVFEIAWIPLALFSVLASYKGWAQASTLTSLSSLDNIFLVAGLILFCTVAPHYLNGLAAKNLPASVVAIGITLQPPISALLEKLMFGSQFDQRFHISAILITGGVVLTALEVRKLKAREVAELPVTPEG
jgi:drug/metabolite transporter (DMT)-like permease